LRITKGENLMKKRRNERGSGLLFAMIFVLILSVMAASLMFLSQSESWAGMNYKMLTQTRYGAEAGINAAANYLMYTYVPPASMAGYNVNVYPVTDNAGNNIILSSISGQSSNYPDAAALSAFQTATNSSASSKTLTAGNMSVNYTATAQLLYMTQIIPFGSNTIPPTRVTVQTWKLTAHGDIASLHNAEEEVSAILERQITPTFAFAAFATNGGCGALAFNGNGNTDSYDSSTISYAANGSALAPPSFQNYGGNVGTNGNESDSGNNVTINGSLSTPRVGVGACSSGNVTALSGNINGITGGIKELPQALNLNPPNIPAPGSTNVNTTATLCPTSAPTTPTCPSGEYGDINLSGSDTVSLVPGIYNINSLSLSGNATFQIVPDPVTGLYGPVIINVTGNNQATPISVAGNGFSNPTYDPSYLQLNYAGTGTIKIAGNGASAAVVYAPEATVDFKGNGAFYGSVVGAQVTDVGNGAIHYDRKLQRKLFTVGNYMLSTFTWAKY
jgi:hypothetical protein